MWVFLSSRLRRWVVMAVAVPLTLTGLRWLRRRIEARHGTNRLTRGLAKIDAVAARTNGARSPETADVR